MSARTGTASLALVLCTAPAWAAPGKQITIADAALHQFEDGPPLPGSYQFIPGETVFISARFGEYQATDTEPPRLLLTYQFEALDPDGVRIVEEKTETLDAGLHPEDKNWLPKVRHEVLIPPLAGTGAYKIVVRVKDQLSGTAATRELPFQVRGRHVEPSRTLVVRNFRFLRTDEDGPPLTTPAYRPGDAVWARFDITGYKFGEKNRFSVSYGLEVLRASGESMYAEPKAAEESEESFYPKRYMPGVLNLNLDPDIARGDYTIVLRIRDHLGNQAQESRHVFHVE